MTRIIRSFFGVGLVIVGIVIVGATAAMASSSSQTTQIDITVPSSISMSGLGASYAATIPGGTSANVDTGPVTIATNNGSGYTLKIAGQALPNPVFQGNLLADSFPFSADTLAACDSSFAGCVSAGALTAAGTTVKTTSGPTVGDSVGVRQSISVPSSAPADIYSAVEIFTATANP